MHKSRWIRIQGLWLFITLVWLKSTWLTSWVELSIWPCKCKLTCKYSLHFPDLWWSLALVFLKALKFLLYILIRVLGNQSPVECEVMYPSIFYYNMYLSVLSVSVLIISPTYCSISTVGSQGVTSDPLNLFSYMFTLPEALWHIENKFTKIFKSRPTLQFLPLFLV